MFRNRWNGEIGKEVALQKKKLTIIAGPCMLETLELGLKVGTFLQEQCLKNNVNYVFKASYDKANRTSKGAVRGPGLEQGLQWLEKITQTLGAPILTDVHTPEQAIEAGKIVDIVQIPAFLCEQRELLFAAAQTGKTIQIKKGQHTSFEQTLIAGEYLEEIGNPKVILCERGSAFGYNNLVVDYRNMMEWRAQGFATVFDATHSAQLPGGGKGFSGGLRHVVPGLACAAVAMGVDGIFMEVHEDPSKALSDAATQLTFETAASLIRRLAHLHKASIEAL